MPKPQNILDPIGPILFHRDVHRDQRGAFVESYHEGRYEDLGLHVRFVQTNCSTTLRGVLRGLHFQHPMAQGKLVSVTRGEVFDVAVDIRLGSPTYGHSFGTTLSADNGLQLWMPPGFAHGFVALSDEADILCHCTAQHDAIAEGTLKWDDPELGIEWPVDSPIVSPKDQAGRSLASLADGGLLPPHAGSVVEDARRSLTPVTGAAAQVVL